MKFHVHAPGDHTVGCYSQEATVEIQGDVLPEDVEHIRIGLNAAFGVIFDSRSVAVCDEAEWRKLQDGGE